jgi:peptide/nickel transport system ATP-binding protein
MEICKREYPALRTVSPGKAVACHLYPADSTTGAPVKPAV